ncbi:MAG: hypothetical protein U0350_10620 [Caldilineaceae bacterium]
MHQLANPKLTVTLADTGSLLAIENHLAGETYHFAADAFFLETDQGRFSNQAAQPVPVTQGQDSLVYHFAFGPLRLELIYQLSAENGFVRRSVKVNNRTPLRLLTLTLGQTVFCQPADEVIHYLTFWMAPTVEFIRYEQGGLFTGIENPFYQAELTGQGVTLNFEPGLILRAGEGYASEAQFIGVYKKSGVMIEDSARPFRYPNGSAHIPIDRNESRAMRAFALDYLQPLPQTFRTINYHFFHPLPQMPSTEEDKWYFLKTIDTFAAIGGDMIIFKPLHRHRKPDAITPYWNVLPDDTGAVARQIADYATQKGITYGFYLGIAGGHGEEGNAAGLPFRPEETRWKKMDAAGRRAPDNCIGCDDFYEWWFQVQDNTIQQYKLSNWSWDPSLGSAMNCYDESHGHIAGKGAYKGWRRCIELTRRLKESKPGLFIQGFYGTKNFGLWGLKYTDQHEVYNEQTAIVCTHHTQISDDRQNADGLRFQNYWSMRFRFLPTVIGHAMHQRMSEGEFDRQLIKAWDFYGWRYALMSALAVSGSLMPAILPVKSDLIPGYAAFYQKWTQWAKVHFDYVPYTEPFGEQVQPGCIDGYARIKGDHGFIFLFNGNPRPAQITFEVGDEINLQQAGMYEFVELYPAEDRPVRDNHGQALFVLGDKASLTLPANSCKLLALRRVTSTSRDHSQNEAPMVKKAASLGYPRELDNWIMADGRLFAFPYHAPQATLTISTSFHLNPTIIDLLERAKPKNFAEMGATIAAWQASQETSYSYHNFIGSRPERLWLVIPFTLQKANALTFAADFSLNVAVNGRDVGNALKLDANGNSFYVDVTELVHYGLAPEASNTIQLDLRHLGQNEFMGPFLLYPYEALSEGWAAEPTDVAESTGRVVYTHSLIPPRPPRYLKGGAPPKITEAYVTGNVKLTQSTHLHVYVDQPPDALQQVLYSHSGFPWMGIVALTYAPALACWVAEVKPGSRAAIQESEKIYVWAVDRAGLQGEYYPVKVGWDFCE